LTDVQNLEIVIDLGPTGQV